MNTQRPNSDKPNGYAVSHNQYHLPQTEQFPTYKQALRRFLSLRKAGVERAWLIETYPNGSSITLAKATCTTYAAPYSARAK